MAGRGPVPKDKRARDRDTPETVDVPITGDVYGPDLPSGVLPDGEEWHPQTVAMWEAFRRWPIMADLPEVSWAFLVDTMLQHHVMWMKGKWEFASEVRLRMKSFFVTPDEQRRAHLNVRVPDGAVKATPGGAKVTDIRSRRSRLTDNAT